MQKQIDIKEEDLVFIKTFYYIKGFATARNYLNTLRALPLVRRIHEGQYRKGMIYVNGQERKIPYITHVLRVCASLMALDLPLTDEEHDTLYAAALLHDVLEDRPELFPDNGEELVTKYNITRETLEIIRMVSKRSGATEPELEVYFDTIRRNKLALLLKVGDRSDNVETLVVMKDQKLQKYIDETRKHIYPMLSYGKETYPELSNALTILKSKIVALTEATEALMYRFLKESGTNEGGETTGVL